jgi:hypothetical protein
MMLVLRHFHSKRRYSFETLWFVSLIRCMPVLGTVGNNQLDEKVIKHGTVFSR